MGDYNSVLDVHLLQKRQSEIVSNVCARDFLSCLLFFQENIRCHHPMLLEN